MKLNDHEKSVTWISFATWRAHLTTYLADQSCLKSQQSTSSSSNQTVVSYFRGFSQYSWLREELPSCQPSASPFFFQLWLAQPLYEGSDVILCVFFALMEGKCGHKFFEAEILAPCVSVLESFIRRSGYCGRAFLPLCGRSHLLFILAVRGYLRRCFSFLWSEGRLGAIICNQCRFLYQSHYPLLWAQPRDNVFKRDFWTFRYRG